MVVFIKNVHLVSKWIANPQILHPALQTFAHRFKNIFLRQRTLYFSRQRNESTIQKTTCTKISLAEQQLWLGCSRAALRQKSATAATCNHPSNPALAIQMSGCPLWCPEKLSFLIFFFWTKAVYSFLEPQEQISNLKTNKQKYAIHFQFYIVITMGKSAKNLIWS